jgi:hypothetical protein
MNTLLGASRHALTHAILEFTAGAPEASNLETVNAFDHPTFVAIAEALVRAHPELPRLAWHLRAMKGEER